MGIYEFKEEDAFNFARHVGAQTKVSGNEIQFKYCPYCKGGHNGKRDVWTFSVNKDTGAFNCKRSSCSVKGNMIQLSRDFDFSLGRITDEYFRPRKQYRTFKRTEPIIPKEAAVKYMESRGISEEVTKRYEITSQTEHDNILVFPFYDERKILRFIKYRKTDYDKSKDKNKEWCEANCMPILFGMNQCNLENRTVCVTEGQIDSLSLAESGIENAVSVPTGAKGFTWIPYCWDWMQNFDEIIVFGDNENGHITLLDEFSQRFGQKVKHVREEDYKDCKDANEILQKYGKDQVKKCVENAVPLPVKQVLDLCDVEDVDIFAQTKLKTGISQLDRLLYGGLPFGGVHLLTARAGSGKSTLASQIIVRARYQGYKCFVYSGELPNYMFKQWMNFQVAGRNSVFTFQTPNMDYEGYGISSTNKHLISEWYRDYIYLYDNSVTSASEKQEGLLDTIVRVIQQYGVKVILLDNLMTAMLLDKTVGTDENSKQTDFMNKLRLIGVQYDVMIILIAHMRKSTGTETSNDEIAGTSNIPNLAMLTIAFEKDKKSEDENVRLIKLMKNRLFGKTDFKGIQVSYDERSRRIYGDGDDLDFDYGFDPTADGFVDVPEGDGIDFR